MSGFRVLERADRDSRAHPQGAVPPAHDREHRADRWHADEVPIDGYGAGGVTRWRTGERIDPSLTVRDRVRRRDVLSAFAVPTRLDSLLLSVPHGVVIADDRERRTADSVARGDLLSPRPLPAESVLILSYGELGHPSLRHWPLVGLVEWLSDASEQSVRLALGPVAPTLASGQMVLSPKAEQPNPLYWSGSAIVDEQFMVKFAWAEAPAIRVWREGVLLGRLAAADTDLPLPRVVHVSSRPALTITEVVPGSPLSWEWASDRSAAEAASVAHQLGAFVGRLHLLPADSVLHDLPPFVPSPQADTTRLRTRYPSLVDEHRARIVLGWCDWVDDALAPRDPALEVLAHGDLHGYNQLWDHHAIRLTAVVDFEESGIAEPEFDFRYLPGNSQTPRLTLAAIDTYQRLTGNRVDLRRVLAWNIRTHLGDALWRTEAKVQLPGGGDATTWVDDLVRRLSAFGFDSL